MDQRGPVVQGALLRRRLTELRRQSGLTQEEVARRLEWHTSKLIRIEGGRTGISKVDLDALGQLYGVTDPALMEELRLLNREARSKAWWSSFKNDVSDAYLAYVGFEAGASVIRQFQPLAVPGLLQTEDYAETLAHAAMDADALKQLVKLRMMRQQTLRQRPIPPYEIFVLDEAVIRRRVGISRDRAIMPTQLRHMARVAQESERISIRIVPFETGSHVGMLRGAFTLLEFDSGLGELLHRENGDLHETLTGEDPRISEVRADFEAILGEALDPAESLTLILEAAASME
ncbi:helix-turn-helix domain-containing protein [Nonomuraea angiospora]|uniref:Transcriptional regulator with XRE-family HTH domain n=1 Tax=Nonomuraea angiospora TaxID=46172 RepID=A0ABR9M1E9_9ACTN|nr:helix-turn-helix transcriptional regulator [Nonomuraea angiospora]MBE1586732.1 transcriptional regulator with XRE-family HTH domain [Nonomuraea angiospora]